MEVFYLIGLFILTYLIGSIPFAYWLIKGIYKMDLRFFGAGDLGALNAFRIKKNIGVALVIGLFDLGKGMLSIWLAHYFFAQNFTAELLATGGVLFGDVFPVWLNFRGSRGLAVSAGVLLLINPYLVAVWLILFVDFYLIVRQHIIAILIASFGLPLIVFFTLKIYFTGDTLILILLVSTLIFQRHLERVPDLVAQKNLKIKNGEGK